MNDALDLWKTGIILRMGSNVIQEAKIIRIDLYEETIQNELKHGSKLLYKEPYKKNRDYMFVVFEKEI